MITFRVSADVPEDRRVIVTLPSEVPKGTVELEITVVAAETNRKPARTSLAEWAEANAEDWGDRMSSTDVEGFTGRKF